MRKYSITFLVFVSLILSGCGVLGTPVPTHDELATIVAATLTSIPPASSTPEVATSEPFMLTPTPTLTPETVGIRYLYTSADNVNLRVNPGRLFKVSRVMTKGTKLQVLGVSPGGAWLNVLNDEGISGWVGVDFVTGGFDGPPLPVVTPKDAQLVTGKVLDSNGNPIDGIGFALVQNNNRDDASTDDTGTFYFYLPLNLSGSWTLSFVSVNCTSSTMDANCQCVGGVCGKPDPEVMTILLPISTSLAFTWK